MRLIALFLVVCLTCLLGVWSHLGPSTPPHETDAEMIRWFWERKAEFEHLASVIRADANFRRLHVQPSSPEQDGSSPPWASLMSPEKRAEWEAWKSRPEKPLEDAHYRRCFRSLKVGGLVTRRDDGDLLFFEMTRKMVFYDLSIKGYAYGNTVPGVIVSSLDEGGDGERRAEPRPYEIHRYLRPLGGGWYLYLEVFALD